MLACIVSLGIGQFTAPTVEVDLTETVNVSAPVIVKQIVSVTPKGACQIRVGTCYNQLAFFTRFRGSPRRYGAVISGCFGNAYFSLNPGKRPCLGIGCEGLVATPGTTKHDAAVLGCPVRVDIVFADVIHGKLLDCRRYRFSTERAHTQCGHVEIGHLPSTCRVRHDCLQEG